MFSIFYFFGLDGFSFGISFRFISCLFVLILGGDTECMFVLGSFGVFLSLVFGSCLVIFLVRVVWLCLFICFLNVFGVFCGFS